MIPSNYDNDTEETPVPFTRSAAIVLTIGTLFILSLVAWGIWGGHPQPPVEQQLNDTLFVNHSELKEE